MLYNFYISFFFTNRPFTVHGVLDFEFGRKKLSPLVTTDSDTVFREESIGGRFQNRNRSRF